MVSEPDTGQSARKDARPPRGVDYEIPYWLESGRNIPHKGEV